MKLTASELVELDLKHVWHPCSQMKDYELFKPIPVSSARGSFLYTSDGRAIIDAISSWWCKSLGHSHPEIKAAVIAQLDRYEHIIGANTCSEPLVLLSASLAELVPPLDRCFYTDNGSTALEIAMKMSVQYNLQSGSPQRQLFVALENGYHGESVLTLGAGDCDLYSAPFAGLIPKITKLRPMAYCKGPEDPAWNLFPEENWKKIEAELAPLAETVSAILFEPVLQGSGGMLIYSPDFLRRLRRWADEHKVHLIADEVMTGFGRTGKMLACEHAGITPDFICLSKGFSSGFAPFAAVLTSSSVYEAFYDDYLAFKAFMHSNTFTGYAPGAAAALAAIKIFRRDKIAESVEARSSALLKRMQYVADESGSLVNVRGIGFMAAADIVNPASGKPYPKNERRGFQFYRTAVEEGALLRPLGDTIYFLPPLNTDDSVLDQMTEIALKSLRKTIGGK